MVPAMEQRQNIPNITQHECAAQKKNRLENISLPNFDFLNCPTTHHWDGQLGNLPSQYTHGLGWLIWTVRSSLWQQLLQQIWFQSKNGALVTKVVLPADDLLTEKKTKRFTGHCTTSWSTKQCVLISPSLIRSSPKVAPLYNLPETAT